VKIDEVVGQATVPGQIWLRASAPQNGGVDPECLSQGAPLFVARMADEARLRAAEQLASTAKRARFAIRIDYVVAGAAFVLADGDQTRCEALRVSFGD
jgi:hypothetical protein